MGAEEPKTKGVGFLNVRTFTESRFGGAAGWDAVLAQLVPADRAALEGMVSVGWYSLALYARLIRALDQVFGYGDLSLVVQLGRYEAEHDLTTIQRLFLRFANPAFILEKTGDYWRRFHDTGHWTIERQTDRRVMAYLDDWGVVDLALCRELVGYVGRAFELVGAKNVRLEHRKCRSQGAARCEFFGCWGAVVADARDPATKPANSSRD